MSNKLDRSITFEVVGHAEPAGSKRSFVPLHPKTKQPYRDKNGRIIVNTVDDNPKSKDWKKLVAAQAKIAFDGREPFSGAVALSLAFRRARPKSHFKSSGALSAEGERNTFPTTKPDLLKLARAVEDALTGIAYKDDSQIAAERLFKLYSFGDQESVLVSVSELSVSELAD